MDISFIIPIRIESEDRLRNCVSIVSYLLNTVPTGKVYIKEVDSESVFQERAFPLIRRYADTENLNHTFEQSSQNSLFHRTKYINDLFEQTSTKVVWHYDVDVIFPKETYEETYKLITEEGYDFVYPYGCGVYQNAVNYPEELFRKFLDSKFDLSLLQNSSSRKPATVGFSQVFNRYSYIDFGMMNENFMSWGCEDVELYYRMSCLGYKIGRIPNDLYHLEHARTFNSHYNNPKFNDNNNLWEWFRRQNKETIRNYYNQQKYLKQRLS